MHKAHCACWVLSFASGPLQVIQAHSTDTGGKNSKNGSLEMENWIKKCPGLGTVKSVTMPGIVYLAIAIAAEVPRSPKPRTGSTPFFFLPLELTSSLVYLFFPLNFHLCLVFYSCSTKQFSSIFLYLGIYIYPYFWLAQNFASPVAFCGLFLTHSLV